MDDERRSRSDELAATRTVLAADRTLMAWIRTSLAMISAGFGIYKFLHGLQETETIRPLYPMGARNLGLFLTSLGAGSLIAGIIEYVDLTRVLGRPRAWLRPSFFVACVTLVVGILVLVGVGARIGPLR